MNTMELDVRRAALAREILNTDDEELLTELEKAYKTIKERLLSLAFVQTKAESLPDSKEYILNSIEEGYLEMQEIKAGRKKEEALMTLLKNWKWRKHDD